MCDRGKATAKKCSIAENCATAENAAVLGPRYRKSGLESVRKSKATVAVPQTRPRKVALPRKGVAIARAAIPQIRTGSAKLKAGVTAESLRLCYHRAESCTAASFVMNLHNSLMFSYI